uniref:Uncharacterized protein n=1 Tax=Anguilla anguilla TaxID=7936 RepID=A0A0E9QVE7_ANGAN
MLWGVLHVGLFWPQLFAPISCTRTVTFRTWSVLGLYLFFCSSAAEKQDAHLSYRYSLPTRVLGTPPACSHVTWLKSFKLIFFAMIY